MKRQPAKPKAIKRQTTEASAEAELAVRFEPVTRMPPAANLPAANRQSGSVTLWGEITAENDGHLKMAIKNHGAALDIGVCGTHWIAKRQIFGNPGHIDGYDYVRVSYAYASLLAQSSQRCE